MRDSAPVLACLLLLLAVSGCFGDPQGTGEGTGDGPTDAGGDGPEDAPQLSAVPYVASPFTAHYVAADGVSGDVEFAIRPTRILSARGNFVDGHLGSWDYVPNRGAGPEGPYGLGHLYGLAACGAPVWESQENAGWPVVHVGSLAVTAPPLLLVGGTSLADSSPSRATAGDWMVEWSATSPSEVRVDFGQETSGGFYAIGNWNLTYAAGSVLPVQVVYDAHGTVYEWRLGSTDAVETRPCEEPGAGPAFPSTPMTRLPEEDPPLSVSLSRTVRAVVDDLTMVDFQQFQLEHPEFFLETWNYMAPPEVPDAHEGWRLSFGYPGGAQRLVFECPAPPEAGNPIAVSGCTTLDGYSDPEDPSATPDWDTWRQVSYSGLEARLAPLFGDRIDVFDAHINRHGNFTAGIGWRDTSGGLVDGMRPYHTVSVDLRKGAIEGARGLELWLEP